MERRVDREIQAWSGSSARSQLALLWDEVDRDTVKSISYWERDEWSSPYMICASQRRRASWGSRRTFLMLDFGRPDRDEVLLSDDTVIHGRTTVAERMGARENRRMLELPGVDQRPELCDLLISLGFRRDEMDFPALTRFAGHDDEVVRYVVLGMLSWNPSVTNDYLAGKFESDPDHRVRDLAARFASGRARRITRS
jgi:hypothetical protein